MLGTQVPEQCLLKLCCLSEAFGDSRYRDRLAGVVVGVALAAQRVQYDPSVIAQAQGKGQ